MMFETDPQSYYEILDIKPDAGQNEIRQAYFRAKAAYGKDSAALYSLFDEHETRLVLETIEQAYLVLSNPDKRKEYDRVHGFLRAEEQLPQPRKAPRHANVFSFSKPPPGEDAAHMAARSVFGAGAMDEMGNSLGEPPSAPAAMAQVTAPSAHSVPPPPPMLGERLRNDRAEDYATPRMLASHGSAGPPVRDYSPPKTFPSHENRLGIVRRVDLVKPHEINTGIEEEIVVETAFRGDFLKKIREYRQISVEELSEFTKISRTYINCIECEEFESLPAPAYLRGFIVQIAKALKLPHEKAAGAYMAHYRNTVLK